MAQSLDVFTKQFLRAFSAYGIPQGFPDQAAHQELAQAFVDFAESGLAWSALQTQLDDIAALSPLEDYYGHVPVGFRSFDRLDDAVTWVQQTRPAFTDWVPVNLASIALDYVQAEDLPTARGVAEEAEKVLAGHPLPQLTNEDLVVFSEAMARVYLAVGDLDKAAQYSGDRMELATEDGSEGELIYALWLEAEVTRAQGNEADADELQARADGMQQKRHEAATLRARSRLDEAAHALAHHYVNVISPTVDASATDQQEQVFRALNDVAGSELSYDELQGFGKRVSGVLTSHINLPLTEGHTTDLRMLLPSMFVRKGFDGGLALMSAEVFATGLPYFAGFTFALATGALMESEDQGAQRQLPVAVDRAIADWEREDQQHEPRMDQPGAAALANALVYLERYEEAERWSREAMAGLGSPVQFISDDDVRRTRMAVLEHLQIHEDEQAELRRGMARAVGAGRNDPCPCGSGKKFKHCCGRAA